MCWRYIWSTCSGYLLRLKEPLYQLKYRVMANSELASRDFLKDLSWLVLPIIWNSRFWDPLLVPPKARRGYARVARPSHGAQITARAFRPGGDKATPTKQKKKWISCEFRSSPEETSHRRGLDQPTLRFKVSRSAD